VPDTVQIRLQTRLEGNAAHLQMSVQGARRAGMSLYRDGKRIPMRYRVVDARGAAVAEGAMQYG